MTAAYATPSPLLGWPLDTREDVQNAVRRLAAPLAARFSPGGARVRLGETGAHYPDAAAELEGFARPLWGLAPLAAGGGAFDGWARYRAGLVSGTDPAHPEYWGDPEDRSQTLVEMAALGLGLALAPHELWEPLGGAERARLAGWLRRIDGVALVDNNWQLFRPMVHLGLERVGEGYDARAGQAAWARAEAFDLGGGWFSDGPVTGDQAQIDYYVPFALHYYALIHAQLAGGREPERAARTRARAALFALDFVHWFAASGAALPFGRSLTYRFAQGAFWGALAYANVEALPWGVLKGLWLRHLRWWARQPIFSDGGVLSIGYAYPNLNVAEQYNSPASPYWAMKFFLPLALDAAHPFWTAAEAPLPPLEAVRPQPQPGLVLCRDEARDHVFALGGRQHRLWVRHGAEKYAKFAYSSAFGFSVPGGTWGLERGAFDSILALSDDGEHYRARERPLSSELAGEVVHTVWAPFSGVRVETWLVPCPPWHVRLHRLTGARALHSAEGGWALDRAGEERRHDHEEGPGLALAVHPAGLSGLLDLAGDRAGRLVRPDPNSNLLAPRTVIPTLLGRHGPGEHWLACAVLGLPGPDPGSAGGAVWSAPPAVTFDADGAMVNYGGRRIRLWESAPGETTRDGVQEVQA